MFSVSVLLFSSGYNMLVFHFPWLAVFAPPPVALVAQTISSDSILLFWNVTFDTIDRTYLLSYTVVKLTGSPLEQTEFNQTVLCETVSEPHDCNESLDGLIPYAEYSFSLVAVYNDTDRSTPVMANATTLEGSKSNELVITVMET